MLQHLHIKNYALIDTLDIELSEGFVVITGETGAGKSIILGALGLLLGERANLSSIGNPEKKCIVEGHFYIENYKITKLFEQEDLDYEPTTTIRRELLSSGKSRAFVNDTPVNLATLRKITSQLIDIHSQHQNLEIEDESFQFQLVDSLARNKKERNAYQTALKKLKELEKKKDNLLASQQQQSIDLDYWKFQLDELQTVQLKANEQEELEAESRLFSQLENIQYALSQADDFLNGENSPISHLHKISTDFGKLKAVHTAFPDFEERLNSIYIELKDLAQEIASETEQLQDDPERSRYVNERLDTLYRLQQKHGKTTISELLTLQNELTEKINAVDNFETYLATIDKAIKIHNAETECCAAALTQTRKRIIPEIQQTIISQLNILGMPHAKIALQLEECNEFRTQGKERLSILFSANKNMPLANISEVASGGELSRLMLTIKQIMAKSLVLPTLIFDEIDTGVSGEIADKMGQMMQNMSKQIQLIAITHLPQIAAKAKQHWEVYKQETTEKTITSIQNLQDAKRIEALARMLSGSQLTKEAIANAKVLLGNQ